MNHWDVFLDASVSKILDWAAVQPWAKAMAKCQQDAIWHAEGNVWTHTKMVVRQLELLEAWPAFTQEQRRTLLFTALFHDAGKVKTTITDPQTGRVHAPKHSIVSMELVRDALRELHCPITDREVVAQLVRYHGRPPFLLEKTDPAREVIALSWHLPNDLLYWFTLADTRGRATTDTIRPEETLHLWKMLAEEFECFDQAYTFANAKARLLFYREELSSLHYAPHEDYSCTVTMMAGLPGAGKDTWLRDNAEHLPVVSLDEVRSELEIEATEEQGPVIQAAREKCRVMLRAKKDFAFNATNISRLTRKRWIDLFLDYDAKVKIVYIEPPMEIVLAQNEKRPHSVPASVIHKLAMKLEPPAWDEGHDINYVEPRPESR